VNITPTAGKKIEHQGIKVELLGTIELFFDRGNTYDFCAMGACRPRARGVKP
jgi:vacuolar protein sorting-associated protein 26